MHDAFEVATFGTEPLPLVVSPKRTTSAAEFMGLLKSERGWLSQRLLEHGGLLFRGWPVEDAHDFQAAIDALGTGSAVNYIGGDSPRTKIVGSVYSSTEAPADLTIPLHNELSFVRHYPKHIFFYCERAPVERGETILGDARRVYRALDPEVRERFLARQLKYVSAYYGKSLIMDVVNAFQRSHKSWHEVFETRERDEVERLCREHDFEFRWHGRRRNWIKISQTRPAAITHPETREWVWFCQPHLYDFNPRLLGGWRFVGARMFYARPHTRLHEVFHGDGGRVERDDIYHVMDVLEANTIRFAWQRRDVLVLDNVLSMHGRASFTGPRRILAAMTG